MLENNGSSPTTYDRTIMSPLRHLSHQTKDFTRRAENDATGPEGPLFEPRLGVDFVGQVPTLHLDALEVGVAATAGGLVPGVAVRLNDAALNRKKLSIAAIWASNTLIRILRKEVKGSAF